MIFPNRCVVIPKLDYDEHGQQRFGSKVPEKCAIVKLTSGQQHTSVRADQTASRAHADEFVADVVLLMTPNTKLKVNDKLEIGGLELRARSLQQQYSVTGVLDHIQAGLEQWA